MFADGKKHKTRHTCVGSCDVAILAFSALMILPGCTKVRTRIVPEIVSFEIHGDSHLDVDTETLKVMTLNLGHGKGRGLLQEFVGNKKTRANLDKVVELLDRERPHVVAFQEADIKSRRSGNFNHVHYIAERAGYKQAVHGQHVKGFGLNHGTALISRLRMSDPLSVAFDPALPAPDKGFVVCTVEFGAAATEVDVVSVHLDVVRNSTRRRQVRQMAAFLSTRTNPLVVMGDFN
ncbi:MAG: endonuclease/exonuclease/phosphatase family protein, partial [Planctomycetota bacterium]